MPRVAGVSGSSATRPILLSRSPTRVSRCLWWRREGLPVCSTLMVLPALLLISNLHPAAVLLDRLLALAALAAPRLQRRYLDVAPRRDRARRILPLERVEGRPHHVVGIGRAERFRHHVLHAERLEDGAHRAARDNAGAGWGRPQVDLAGAVAPRNVVMERAAFAQRHPNQIPLGGIGRLADRFRHLARLAVAEADAALLVADHHKRRKAEAPAALHHLGHTVDVDQLVGELALFPLALAIAITVALSWFTCHIDVPFRCSVSGRARPVD